MRLSLRSIAPRGWLAPLLAAPTLPYGGQAAIEGVLMKGTDQAALAVRRRDGRIEVMDRPARPRFPRLVKLPFVRGFFVLWDMMTLGLWALQESSKRFEQDQLAAEREERAANGEEAAQPEAEPGEMAPWLRTMLLGV